MTPDAAAALFCTVIMTFIIAIISGEGRSLRSVCPLVLGLKPLACLLWYRLPLVSKCPPVSTGTSAIAAAIRL